MRWLLVRLMAWMPLLLLVVAVNWTGDPGHLFRHSPMNRRIAQLMLEGKNVEVPRNFDQGQVLAEYAAQSPPPPPEVIVLGSSHMHLVRGSLFPGKRFFNASLAGADLETMIGAYGLFYPRGTAPRIVILGLDPWILSPTYFHSIYYPPLNGSLEDMADRLKLAELKPKQDWPARINRYYQIVSPSYFQSSLKAIREEHSLGTMVTTSEDSDGWTKRADGSFMSYDRSAREETTEQITMAVRKRYAEGSGADLGFDGVSPERVRILRAFLELLHRSGVRVIALLPPMHREHYQAAVRAGRAGNIAAIENAFRNETSRLGFELRGDYDASRCGLSDEDFFDEGHMHEEAEMRLFKDEATTAPTTGPGQR